MGMACREGHTDVLRCLLQHRANISDTVLGLSGLHLAARECHPTTAAYLLSYKVNPSAAEDTELKKTPLMYAAEAGCLATVSLLVTFSANILDRDSKGQTVSDYCSSGLARPEIAGGIREVLDRLMKPTS